MSVALMSHRGALDPGRWSPKELGTLSLWLDADDATTITLATGVSQWNDKSGNGYNVSQATGANQPTWARSSSTARGSVTFVAASAHLLVGPDALDIRAGGMSYAALVTQTSTAVLLSKTTGAIDANGEWQIGRINFNVRLNSINRAAGVTASSNLGIMAGVLDRNASITHYRDSVAGTPVTAGFPNTTDYNTTALLAVGGRADGTNNVDAVLYELVVAMATWTTAERQTVEGYLAHKHYQTALLPSDHPYKSVAP